MKNKNYSVSYVCRCPMIIANVLPDLASRKFETLLGELTVGLVTAWHLWWDIAVYFMYSGEYGFKVSHSTYTMTETFQSNALCKKTRNGSKNPLRSGEG